MKRLLLGTVGCGLLLSGCGLLPTPNEGVVQLSAGTFNVQGQSTLGTALLLRVVLPNGAPPTQDVQVTITGPSGWNSGKPLTMTYPANEYATWALLGTAPAMNGSYSATIQAEGRAFSTTSASIDTASKLGVPGNVTVAQGANQTLTVSWQPVNDAAVYLERIVRVVQNQPDEPVAGASFYTKTTSVSIPESALQLNTNYGANVLAFNADVSLSGRRNLVLPAQFNASRGFYPKVFQRTP